ncbi:WG repeat-containing protein [Moraxella nasibovis]|uniref:WG repeat-containing protein n=1 Tax=Moraxella nasibovis TaxID=2904120 RepID=UPI00240ED223|nr:WG repeat-containing protein [Moraxella nasibovis]WFF38838.1 WG repeat-containing protein [Moraxella nasibovis]
MAQKHHVNYHQQYDDNIFLIKRNGKFGLVDKNNNPITSVIYDDILPSENGLFRAVLNDEWYILNQQGKVISPAYHYIGYIEENCTKVKLFDKFALLHIDDGLLTDFVFDYIYDFLEGFARIRQGNKNGYLDKNGKIVIDCQYDDVGYFSQGLSYALKDGKYGYINTQNQTVIDFIYDDAGTFSEDLARVVKDDKTAFIDKTGKVIIDWMDYEAKYFLRGVAQIIIDEKIGFIDKTGNIIIEPQFEYASYFDEKTDLANAEKDGKEFKINRQGKQVGKAKKAVYWTEDFLLEDDQ